MVGEMAEGSKEQELVDRFKETGDRSAFAALIELYERRVYRYGYRMCGHAQDAEDVVQDTFLSAFRYLKDFRGQSSLSSWLYKIASSACIEKRRLRKDQPRNVLSLNESVPGQLGETAELTERPEELAVRAEMRRSLEQALAALPENHRMILLLRDVEGFSTREVAEILDVTESAAKVRLHRARSVLQRKYLEVTGRQS